MPTKLSTIRCSLTALAGAGILGAFMALGLVAEGALKRVDLANQEAFSSPGRTASDVAMFTARGGR